WSVSLKYAVAAGRSTTQNPWLSWSAWLLPSRSTSCALEPFLRTRTRRVVPSPFHNAVTRWLPGLSKATWYTCQLGTSELGSPGHADHDAVSRTSGTNCALV